MHLNDYSKVRTALQSNAAPANEATRAALAGDLHDALRSTGAFHTVEVDCTDDADRLVIAMVGFEPGADASVLAARLQRLWLDRVGQGFWTAHASLVDDGHVELLAATRPNVRDGYVTLHLVAQAGWMMFTRLPSGSVVRATRCPLSTAARLLRPGVRFWYQR